MGPRVGLVMVVQKHILSLAHSDIGHPVCSLLLADGYMSRLQFDTYFSQILEYYPDIFSYYGGIP
jgi:hypothetical protein